MTDPQHYDAHKCMVLATEIADLPAGDFRLLWAWLATSTEITAEIVENASAREYYLSTMNHKPQYGITASRKCESLAGRFMSLHPWERQNVLYRLIPRVEASASAAAMAAAALARRVDE